MRLLATGSPFSTQHIACFLGLVWHGEFYKHSEVQDCIPRAGTTMAVGEIVAQRVALGLGVHTIPYFLIFFCFVLLPPRTSSIAGGIPWGAGIV